MDTLHIKKEVMAVRPNKAKLRLKAVGRLFFMIILISVYPILIRLPWKIIFGVNAGSENDTKNYSPSWFAKITRASIFYPIGIIKLPIGYGLQLGAQYSNEEIKENSELTYKLIKFLKKFKNTDRICLNGVIPSAAAKHGVWPDDDRFVTTQFGTLFMVNENIKEIRERHPHVNNMPIGVVGCGYTGTRLIEYLSEELHIDVIGFDSSQKGRTFKAAVFAGDQFSKIRKCGIVIILTTQGNSGIESILSHLNPHSVVLSDTHPKITNRMWERVSKRVCAIYESATKLPGCYFFPSFPRWAPDTVPGCTVQGITESYANKVITSQIESNELSRKWGFIARLDRPGGEHE